MDLNLPIFDRVADCKNILIAGMGGGFDVFCGLPIYFELKKRGFNVHLASYSFTDIDEAQKGVRLTDTLLGVDTTVDTYIPYFPERYLAKWFQQARGEKVTIWTFAKTGVFPLFENYQILVRHLEIDAILLVDGGVDSLVHGDEIEMGSLVEDTISLSAVGQLHNVPVRLMACLGMGAETEINYPQILENIAQLAQAGAFLGSCSLTKNFASYQAYESAVLFVQSQPYQDPSVINSSVVSAVQGNHGNYHLTSKTKNSHLSISPLMSIYWFFELSAIVDRNMFFSQILTTRTVGEALLNIMMVLRFVKKRSPSRNTFG